MVRTDQTCHALLLLRGASGRDTVAEQSAALLLVTLVALVVRIARKICCISEKVPKFAFLKDKFGIDAAQIASRAMFWLMPVRGIIV